MTEVEPWSCSPYLESGVGGMEIRSFQERVSQLESDLGAQRERNESLEQRLRQADEQMGDEVQRRGTAELDRELLIDALMERNEELCQQQRTVQTLTDLLDRARADARGSASNLRETRRAVALLKEYVDGVLVPEEPPVASQNKKRKLSP